MLHQAVHQARAQSALGAQEGGGEQAKHFIHAAHCHRGPASPSSRAGGSFFGKSNARGHGPSRRTRLRYLTTFTFAVELSCFCSPFWMKFANSVSGTDSPSGMLLSMSDFLNCAASVPSSTLVDTASKSVLLRGVFSWTPPSRV